MRKLIAALVLSLASIGTTHAIVKTPDGKSIGYDIAKGKQASAPCAACHAADGNSVIPANPRLAGQNAKYLYNQLMDFKSGKRKNAIMSGQVANLTPQDMYNIAAYYASQKSAVSMAKTDILAYGEKLYRGGDSSRGIVPCAGCHGPAGQGNRFAAFPKLGGQHAAYVKAQLEAFRAAGREDSKGIRRVNDAEKSGEKGMMQQAASQLSDKDIDALANFVSGLHNK